MYLVTFHYHYNTQRVYFVLKLCFIRILLVFISNICVLLYVICQFCNSTHQKPTVWCSRIKLQIPLKPNITTQQAPTQPVQKTTKWIEGSVRFFSFSVSSRKTRSEMYRDAKLTKCNLLSIASLRVDFTWLMTAFKKQSKCMKVYMMPKTFKYVSQHAVTLCKTTPSSHPLKSSLFSKVLRLSYVFRLFHPLCVVATDATWAYSHRSWSCICCCIFWSICCILLSCRGSGGNTTTGEKRNKRRVKTRLM